MTALKTTENKIQVAGYTPEQLKKLFDNIDYLVKLMEEKYNINNCDSIKPNRKTK